MKSLISAAMYGRLAPFALAVAFLAACGTTGSGSDPTTAAPSVITNKTATPTSDVSAIASAAGATARRTVPPSTPPPPGNARTALFVTRFRASFPQLARGRSDAQITAQVKAACSAITTHPSLNSQQLGTYFASNSVTPDQATTTAIAILAVTTACPITTTPAN
ncbi:MAG: hypothetical protein ACQSGP_21940 [Frankia sp.]